MMKKIYKILLLTIIFTATFCVSFSQENNSFELPSAPLGSPQLREVNTDLEMPKPIKENKKNYQVKSIEEISNIQLPSPTGFDASFKSNTKNETTQFEEKANLPTDFVVLIVFVIIAIVILASSALIRSQKKNNFNIESKTENIIMQSHHSEEINQQIGTLEKLFELKEKGAISVDEYNSLKKKIVEEQKNGN